MKNNKKNKIIAKKDDFIIQYATWNDFPKLKKVANSLSMENKRFYHTWMFNLNPSLKIKLGQIVCRFSLVPCIGSLIKKLFPYGFAVILKCLSKDGQIVGISAIYHFKRFENQKYVVTFADMIKEEFQGIGLGNFQGAKMIEIAKNHDVCKISGGIISDHEKRLEQASKKGWRIVKMEKNADEFNGKKYDVVEVEKDLENS